MRIEDERPTADVLAAHAQLDDALDQLLGDIFPPYQCSEADWSEALRAQADDDLSAALFVNEKGGPPAVWAMLLQMAFEKFAKAAMARTDVNQFRKWRVSREAKSAANAVVALERAHPALARGGPHLEYPWEENGVLRRPKDLQIVRELSDPRSAANATLLFRFASALSRGFDAIFS